MRFFYLIYFPLFLKILIHASLQNSTIFTYQNLKNLNTSLLYSKILRSSNTSIINQKYWSDPPNLWSSNTQKILSQSSVPFSGNDQFRHSTQYSNYFQVNQNYYWIQNDKKYNSDIVINSGPADVPSLSFTTYLKLETNSKNYDNCKNKVINGMINIKNCQNQIKLFSVEKINYGSYWGWGF